MAVGFTIAIEGQEAIARGFARVAQSFDDLAPFWEAIEPWWYGEVDNSFAAESNPALGDWPPLGALTREGPPGRYGAWKERMHPGLPMLELDGTLRRSMTGQDGTSIVNEEPKVLELGSTLPYWRTHQHGRPGDHIPARPFAGLDDSAMRRFNDAIQEVLVELNREWNEAFGGPGGVAR